MTTLDEQTRAALSGDPAVAAIEYHGRWHNWGQVRAVADAVGRLLDIAGVAERAPIVFVPRNRPSAIAAELGMVARRHTISMVYAFQSAGGIARDVGRMAAAAVIAAAEDFTPELIAVVRDKGMAAIALDAMGAHIVEGAERSVADFGELPSAPQIRVHTSGTTGPPKHVGFSYDTIARYMVGQHISALAGEDAAQPPVFLTFPLGNISGIYSVFPPLLARRRALLADRFTIDGWRDYVRRFQPANPSLPPAGIRMILDMDVPKEELACIRLVMTGAAPLDPTVQRQFEERYGIPIILSYGATEFGGPVCAMTPELHAQHGLAKAGSVGQPFAGCALRVIDPDTHEELPPGRDGLLEVRAPRIGDHWIRTTDVGMIDQDGFLFLRGRADGAIVRGGFKLLPETIERALCLHPAVASATVVGIADPRLGQAPAAAIQVKPGETQPSVTELERHLREHVYATHIPTAWLFVDALPLNTSSKPDIVGVRKLFEAV